MTGIADSAVGAILEIPPQTLQDIDKAEKAIKQLALTSAEAAGKVNDHWGIVAPHGLQTFIDKIAEAKKAMDGLGTINVTLNTQAAVQSSEQLSSATQKTSQDVSKAVQDMATSWNDLAKVSIKSFDLSAYGENLTEALARLSELKRQFKNEAFGGANNQAMADEIRQIEEAIRLYKQASDEKNKALSNIQQKQQAQTDKAYLDEQKRLLDRILQLRKDIANISISVQRGTITGKEDMSKDLAQLEQLRKELRETGVAYKDLRLLASLRLSDEGKVQSEIISQNAKNAGLRQEIDERNKLNQAITRANELTAQGQQGKTRLGSGEEAAIQRQLNSDYKAMISIIREQGELKAKVASEGRQMTQQEIDLIASLAQRYKIYYDDIQRVATAYSKMSEAAAKNFQADKSEQLARNAILFADAQNKAAEAAQKVADAQAKAAQLQADKDRSQAESELNRLYTERLRLLKEKEQLENKALVNNAKGLPDLTAKENQLLSELTAKLQSVDSQIQTISNSYRGLAIKAQHAFALDELRQATALQNQFNKALESVDTSKTKQLVTEYKKLYEENQKLFESMRKYYNEAGGTPTTASTGTRNVDAAYREIEARHAEVLRQMRDLESKNIQEIADFRMQKDVEANQRSISEFVQAEAQKTARAKQEAEQQSNDRIQAYQKFLNTYQGAMAAANRLGTRGGQWEDTYENRARVIKNLEAAIKSLNKADADYEWKLKELTDALNKLKSAQNEVKNAMTPTKPMVSPQDAINAAKNATSLKQLQDAYKQLKEVMAATDPKSQAWSQMNSQLQKTKTTIDEIKKKMDEFQSQASKTSNVMGQLQGRIAAAFSVGAIMGFIKKLIEVRAQFELQRVALGAIIQDKDEANKIFLQVQNMALQSPFSIMQMTTFTKQLAAYRIESEKLVGTTKMLSDVSAGLGVDMGRLILAYGQVKSANYLRATEIRQFTEAGLNIAGELAQYFSELQGKMVSVGDVMEMVTKRMVRFEDVEEVFKRVTSAGGLFYDMQKKQSNTISGMLQRITDAWQIMLNDIGKSNQGIIRDALDLIRQMISHWRMLVPIIKTVGGAMTLVFATKGIIGAIQGYKALRASIETLVMSFKSLAVAQKAASIASWATGIGAVISILGLLAGAIAGVYMEANKLNEELERIGTESFDDMNTSIANYIKLADTIRSTNVSYTERQEAIDELNRTYKDILPTYLKEREYIDGNADSYATATQKIKEYYQAKEYQKKIEAVKSSGNFEKMVDELKGLGKRMTNYGWFDKEVPKAMVDSFMEQLANEFVSGETEATLDGVAKRIKEYFGNKLHDVGTIEKDWTGKVIETGDLKAILNSSGWNSLADAFEKWNKMKSSIEEAKFSLTTATSMEEKYAAAAKMHAQEVIDGAQKQINEITAQIQAYFALKTELESLKAKGQWSTEEKERMVALQGRIEQVSASFFQMANSVIPGLDKAFLSNINNVFDLESAIDTVSQKAFPTLATQGVNALKPVKGEVNALTQAVNMLLTQLGIAGQLAGNKGPYTANDAPLVLTPENRQKWADQQNEIWRKEQQAMQARILERKKSNQEILQDEAKRYDIENALADKQILIQERTNQEYANDLRALAKQKEDALKDWDAGDSRARKLMGYTDAEIADMRKEVKFLRSVANEYDPYDDKAKHKGGKGKDEIAELWKNRLKAIQDFYKRYEELRKHFNEEESLTRAKDAFQGLFNVLNMDMGKVVSMGMDKQGLANNIKDMLEIVRKVRPQLADEFEKAFADTQIQVDFKIKEDAENKLKKQLDEMFANYELTEELKKLNLNVDLVFMLGGEPMDLNDLKAKLKKVFEDAGGESAPKNVVKEYKDKLAKIADLELKQRKERIKEYHKYFVKTVGERARIELEYLKKMDDVRKMYEFTDAQRQDAIRQLTEEKNKKLADQVWKDFKDGEVYQMIFKDLDNISESALVTMRTELERIRDSFKGLSPKDLKEINKAIANIDEQIVNRNPFKALGKSFKDLAKYAKERKKLEVDFQKAVKRSGELIDEIAEKEAKLAKLREKSSLYKIDQINEQIVNLNNQIAELEKDGVTSEEEAKINALKEQIKLLEEKKKKLEEIAAQNKDEEDSMHNQIEGLESDVSGLNDELGKSNDKAEEAGNKLSKGSGKAAAIQAAFQKIKQYAEETVSHLDGIIKGLDRMGALSDAAKDNWESFKDGFEAMNDVAEGGVKTMTGYMTGDYAQMVNGILQGIKGTINLIATIFEVGDKKKERQIKSLKESVEELDKAYQKLEKSIEDAYTFSQYNAEFNNAKKNLDEQKKAYQEMKSLEESKKKTDKDKVKEYEDALEEIAEKEKELHEKMIEDMGSTTDFKSTAEDFVSAWLDAFKETGDGLDALNDKWDEFIESMFIKQAALAKAGSIYEKVIGIINNAFDNNLTGFELEQAIDEAQLAAEEGNERLNAYLKLLAEAFNIRPDGNGELILSDLQKGIQNITEPQAAAIEAYLNSMRFAVFEHTRQLDTLIATIQMQYGSGAENPVVTELKGIRSVLDSINSKFDSIIGNNGFQSAIRIVS